MEEIEKQIKTKEGKKEKVFPLMKSDFKYKCLLFGLFNF